MAQRKRNQPDEPKTQLHILKVEVAHGSDRHDVSIYKTDLPTVFDLMDELEKKTRVPKPYQQLIYKGQKLHQTPTQPLSKFGIFNGNRILLVGDKLDPVSDAIFRRIIGVGKDIALIEKSLHECTREHALIEKKKNFTEYDDDFTPFGDEVIQIKSAPFPPLSYSELLNDEFSVRLHMNLFARKFKLNEGSLDRTMIDEYLPQLHTRASQIRKDLEAFHRVIHELSVTNSSEIKQRQNELLDRINRDIKDTDTLLKSMSSTSYGHK